MNQQIYRNLAVWLVIFLLISGLALMLRQGQAAPEPLTFTKFRQSVDRPVSVVVRFDRDRGDPLGRLRQRAHLRHPLPEVAPVGVLGGVAEFGRFGDHVDHPHVGNGPEGMQVVGHQVRG